MPMLIKLKTTKAEFFSTKHHLKYNKLGKMISNKKFKFYIY